MENERWSVLKKYTKIWYFLQTFWKYGLSKKAARAHDLYIIWNNGFFFFRKHNIFSLGRKWEAAAFLRKYMEIWHFLCTRTVLTNVALRHSVKKNQGWSYPAKIQLDWHPRKNSSNSLYFHEDIYRRFHALLSIEIKNRKLNI